MSRSKTSHPIPSIVASCMLSLAAADAVAYQEAPAQLTAKEKHEIDINECRRDAWEKSRDAFGMDAFRFGNHTRLSFIEIRQLGNMLELETISCMRDRGYELSDIKL